jgi:hypothetical protein
MAAGDGETLARVPGRQAMIVQAVLIPLFQAIITGGFTLAIVTAIVSLMDLPSPLGWGAFFGAFVALGSWLSYINKFYAAMLGVYSQTKRDNEPKDYQFQVEAIQEDGRTGFFLDLPFDQDKFNEVCRYVSRHNFEFSQALLSGRGKLLGRSDFEALRAQMIGAGLAQWVSGRSHSQGTQLTSSGRGIVKHYAR